MFSSYKVKRVIGLLLLVLGGISRISAGVSADTMVVTPEGFKPIGELKVGDTVVCLSKTLLPKSNIVTAVQDLELKSALDVMTDDGVVIRVSPEQLFFVANKWVRADQLNGGDMLLKQDRGFIGVKDVHYQQGPVKMRFISVKLHHNFLVSQNGVLVHNGFWLEKAGVCAVCHGAS